MSIDIKKSNNTNHQFKYYDLFGMLFVCVLMISNTVAQKLTPIGPFIVSGAIIVFPITYLISDIMTEVYGYARARRVTWTALGTVILMTVVYQITVALPYIPDWQNQEAFEKVFSATPRIVFASVTAILAGDLVNCYVLAKMKIWMDGKRMWARFVASTFVGQGVDSLIFFTIAFAGVMPLPILITALLTGWLAKTLYEIVMLPVSYRVVSFLKKVEGIDFYDIGTNFTPFSIEITTRKTV